MRRVHYPPLDCKGKNMADERGSQHRSHGSNNRRSGSGNGQHKGFTSRNNNGPRRNSGNGNFRRRNNDAPRRDRDFQRDGEDRGQRSGDGDRRSFHKSNDQHRDRRNFRGQDRNDRNNRNDRNGRNGDRRNTTRRDDQRNRHEDKRREYMASSRKNSDGTVSFPSQNPYTDRRPGEPVMPKGLEWSMLSKDERERLRGLSKEHAENIGLHILAAYTLESTDPKRALEHAKWAAKQASRVDFARETLAMIAYRNEDYKLALREFRTAYRMNGYLDYLPFIADCERGLGNPKKAIEIARSDDAKKLTGEPKAEMFLVYAGALADLKMWNQAIEVVAKLVHAKGLAGEYRMRAAQAEQYFLEQSGRTDEAVALDELIDDLENHFADPDDDETDDNFVVDYDVEDLPDDLQAKLGVTEDDAQYAPFDNESGVNMDDETRYDDDEQISGAEMDIEPAELEERNERRYEENLSDDPDLDDEDGENDPDDEYDDPDLIGDDEEELYTETE